MSDIDDVYNSLLPGRRFCLSRRDLDDYAKLLVEAFPDIRFFRLSFEEERNSKQRPVLIFHNDFASTNYGQLNIIWSPETWDPQLTLHPRYNSWSHGRLPWPNGTIGCSGKISTSRSDELSFMEDGQIYFRCRKGNDDDMRTARKGLRLLTKVASNRHQAVVEVPSLKVIERMEKGRDLWIGRHARQWFLDDPRRITDYFGGHGDRAIRPYQL